MFRSYTLNPNHKHRSKVLRFELDITKGEIRGPDAEEVRRRCALIVEQGGMTGHPYPTFHEISDPLRNLGELAVVLADNWELPADMQAAYPRIEAEAPDPGDFPPGTVIRY